MAKKIIFVLLLGIFSLYAQTTEYLIVDAPIGAQSPTKVLWIQWAGVSRGPGYAAPDSGTIYYDRSPGGGNLSNYRYKINSPWVDTITKIKQDNILDSSGTIRKRSIAFKAVDQPEMGFGVFYCVVAKPYVNLLNQKDTLISNEFVLMIESPEAVDWIGPKDTISDLTPTFTWNANPGVPYYHIILSDDAIKIDTSDGGKVNLQGLSIIWQAITSNTQITYGAPDPSHTITADPPPLSPGKRFTWLVLNNYGNNAAFSSTRIKLPPGEFVIKGKSLAKPKPVYPMNITLNSTTNKTFSFKWTNLDKEANTYKVYVYIGSDFEGINAQLVVWQTEVAAVNNSDTMSVEINAASILTSNKYTWRVIAVDTKGAGSTGDTAGFHFSAPTGTLNVHTRELIKVKKGDSIVTIENPVGLVEIKTEVLDGSLEAPLLFYTDTDGDLSRSRPTGAYRLTTIASDFESQTKTISLKEGQVLDETFYLERPEATIFGKVVDQSGKGISLVSVIGVSDLDDTLTTKTDASGNFILKCHASDWRIRAEYIGYKSTLPSKVTVASAQNLNFGSITMEKNPFTLSGVVNNNDGAPLLGAKVMLFQNGVQIDVLPSTPQTGVFSFSIPAGTYTVKTEKTGFVSGSSTIDMISSKSVTITMASGATVVTGYVYGRTWNSSRGSYVFAPITNASVKFINVNSSDTVKVMTGATYGEFSISLLGAQKFQVFSSAAGFSQKSVPCTLSTQLKTTQNFYDTLNAFATVSGTVKMSIGKSVIGNCNVNLLKIPQGNVVASGKTSSDGTFEIRNIPDGIYSLMAGKDGYVLDSIEGTDSLTVTNGKPDKSSIAFYMKTGDKTIKWYTSENGSVKIQSPLLKTLSSKDSMSNAGSGIYVVNFDAKADSVIDCSYHQFKVADSEIVHIDTIPLLLKHAFQDSLLPVNGVVQLQLKSSDALDSVMVYYKDVTAESFSVLKTAIRTNAIYSFSIIPQRDGSVMTYYFKGFKGKDVYGYDKEVYNVYIKPDTSLLSKLEIFPLTQDTLLFPASYNAQFSLKGYYSSAFIQDTSIDESSVQWTLTNAQGSTITKSTGTSTVVHTGTIKTDITPVTLTVKIDTSKTKLKPGVSSSSSILFRVSGTILKKVVVRRIDPGNPNPITTSGIDRAEFSADGIDESGKVLKISPLWKILPEMAGIISVDGIFKPSKKFIGIVRIIAEANGISGEYGDDNKDGPGLNVRFMIVQKSVSDTAMNGYGCSIVFPPNVVSENEIGMLDLKKNILENRIEKGSGNFQTVASDAYEIKQLQNITLNTTADSVQLLLDLPAEYNADNKKVYIGHWIMDSLKWEILENSELTNRTVKAKLPHFSKYTILAEASTGGYLKVSPNPFSPYVNQRQVNLLHPYYGTCIQFQIESSKPVYDAHVRIYNVVGDLVWSMQIYNLKNSPYMIWWDGKAANKEIIWNEQSGMSVGENGEIVIVPKGDNMCRNGRYFVVLTGKDLNNKAYRFMKPVVLMK